MSRVWRLTATCALQGLGLALVVGLVLVGGAAALGAMTPTSLALIVTLTLAFFALHSSWKMAQAMVGFADVVPAEPRVQASPDGARMEWPALGLVVEGEAAVMREPDLEVRAGGEPMRAPVEQAPEIAREALETLGVRGHEQRAETDEAAPKASKR